MWAGKSLALSAEEKKKTYRGYHHRTSWITGLPLEYTTIPLNCRCACTTQWNCITGRVFVYFGFRLRDPIRFVRDVAGSILLDIGYTSGGRGYTMAKRADGSNSSVWPGLPTVVDFWGRNIVKVVGDDLHISDRRAELGCLRMW